MSADTNGNKRRSWPTPDFISEQGEGALSSAKIRPKYSNTSWGGVATTEYVSLDSVLNESALFAFNARSEYPLDCNKTIKYRQVEFHSESNLLLISYGIRVFMRRVAIMQCDYTLQR
jgi:hypothetical protein